MKYFVLLLLIICSAYAAIFDEMVMSGSNISLNNMNYTIHAADDVLVISGNDLRLILPVDVSIIRNSMEFTYKGRYTDAYLREHGLQEVYSNHDSQYAHHLVVNQAAPTIIATKVLSMNELAPKDVFNMTITLKNIGNSIVTGTYTEDLPSYFANSGPMIVEDDENILERLDNQAGIEWTGNINAESEIRMIQPIELIGIVSSNELITKEGFFNYTYLEEGYKVQTNSLKTTQIDPISIEINMPDTAYVNEVKEIIINLDKIREEKIKVNSMNLFFSDHVQEIKKDSKFDGNHWEGEIIKGTEFRIEIRPLHTGNTSIFLNMSYSYKGFQNEKLLSASFNTKIDEPTVVVRISPEVNSNKHGNISLTVNNTIDYHFKDFEFNISSDIFDDQQYHFIDIDYLEKDFSFNAPFANEDMDILIYYSFKYSSDFDEQFQYKFNKTVTVKGLNFVPAIEIDFVNYSNTDSNTIIFNFNETIVNQSAKGVQAVVTINGRQKYAKLGEGQFWLVFDNLTSSVTDISYMLQYKHGNDMYFTKGNINLPEPVYITTDSILGNQTINGKDSSGIEPIAPVRILGATEQHETPDNYFGESTLKFKMKTVDETMIIALVVVLMTLFVVVSIIVFTAKRKSQKSHMNKPEATEQLMDKKLQKEINGNKIMDFVPMPGTNLSVLEEYIRTQIQKGTSKDKIKKDMIAVGWLEDVIEVFFR